MLCRFPPFLTEKEGLTAQPCCRAGGDGEGHPSPNAADVFLFAGGGAPGIPELGLAGR